MSRSGYEFDLDQRDLEVWRAQVMSSILGKRGQRLLRDLRAAMDAATEKVLAHGVLRDEEGDYCALGLVGRDRGLDLDKIDADDPYDVADALDISFQLASEVAFQNDEAGYPEETPEQRFIRVRRWVELHLQAAQQRGPA